MRKHGPPSVVLIKRNASSESRSIPDSPTTGMLGRGRDWLKGSLPRGKRKPAYGSVNLRHSSKTEDTELLDFFQEFDFPRPESPQGETSEESEPMEMMFEPLHTKLTVERIDESPLEEVEESEELNRIQETPKASNRRHSWMPTQAKLFGGKEKRWASIETEEDWKKAKAKRSPRGRKNVVICKRQLEMPDLSSKPKSWKPIETKMPGSKEEQRWSSIENEKGWKRAKAKRSQTDPKDQRRNVMVDLGCRMQRRNAIVLYGDDCTALRKLVQKDSSEKHKSKRNKEKRKQNRRRSSRSSTSTRSSSIIVRNFVGAESSNASIPKTIRAKMPRRVGPKMKISFRSTLIFLSGVITTVLATQMSAMVDEWLKSQMSEGMDWSRVFDNWVASLMPEDGTQSFIELVSE